MGFKVSSSLCQKIEERWGFFKGELLDGGMVEDGVKRLINWEMLRVREEIGVILGSSMVKI